MPLPDYKAMQDRVMKAMSLSGSAERDIVKDAVNEAGQAFYEARDWDFRRAETFVETVAPYETGTVSVTQGSATVTGSGTTFTAAMEGRKFSLGVGAPWYTILAYSSATSITLDRTFTESSASGSAYIIFQDTYALGAAVHAILGPKIVLHTEETLDYFCMESEQLMVNRWPLPLATGIPNQWARVENNSDGEIQIRVHPIPDDEYAFRVPYLTAYTNMEADADTPPIPERFRDIVIVGAQGRVYEQLPQFAEGDHAERKEALFQRRIAEAWQQQQRMKPRWRALRSFDDREYGARTAVRTPVS